MAVYMNKAVDLTPSGLAIVSTSPVKTGHADITYLDEAALYISANTTIGGTVGIVIEVSDITSNNSEDFGKLGTDTSLWYTLTDGAGADSVASVTLPTGIVQKVVPVDLARYGSVRFVVSSDVARTDLSIKLSGNSRHE